MAQLIKVFVVRSLNGAAFLRRDHRIHALGGGLRKNGIGIVAFVRDQMIGVYPFDRAAGLRAIRPGTFCNNDSDRQTMRIHSQMRFGVGPPLVRLLS